MPPKKKKYPWEDEPPKRLHRELTEMMVDMTLPAIINLKADGDNYYLWTCTLLPEYPPYNKSAFHLEINFPEDYPFKPPKLYIKTKIYHPNIDEKGEPCLAIVLIPNWMPTIRMEMVFQALLAMINTPVPENAMRPEVCEEYLRNNKKFMRNAEEFIRKHGDPRPTDYEMAKIMKKKLKLIKDSTKKN